MSTRACYTFKDDTGEHHVYKHHDGYPEGAATWITKALDYAWPLPRFEADEFAAAFVAANKNGGGDLRLFNNWDDAWDIDYHYIVTAHGATLNITALDVHKPHEKSWQIKELFSGTLLDFGGWIPPLFIDDKDLD